MRCALAAKGFVNRNTAYNKDVILRTITACSADADVVIFGEAFLQGFYAATFDAEHDRHLAVTPDDPVIREIRDAARQYATAVSFGFIEKEADRFCSSQITIDSEGNVANLYRRVSPGWKLPSAGPQYVEGAGFHAFSLMDRRVVVGLCGDLWYDANIQAVNQLQPDVVFWPVYTDYRFSDWNAAVKHEYAQQAGLLAGKVLYVNSFCLDMEGDEIARGGAALFDGGRILREIPAGSESILFVDV